MVAEGRDVIGATGRAAFDQTSPDQGGVHTQADASRAAIVTGEKSEQLDLGVGQAANRYAGQCCAPAPSTARMPSANHRSTRNWPAWNAALDTPYRK